MANYSSERIPATHARKFKKKKKKKRSKNLRHFETFLANTEQPKLSEITVLAL